MNWFVLLGLAVVVLLVFGIYFIWHLGRALSYFDVSSRISKALRFLVVWLLFGAPVLTFGYIFTVRKFGWGSGMRDSSVAIDWLLYIPFYLSLIVVLQVVPFLLVSDAITVGIRLFSRKHHIRKTWRKYGARTCIVVTLFFLVYSPVRVFLERNRLDIRSYEIGRGESANSTKESIRIGFIGDLQMDSHTDSKRAQVAVDAINEKRPDLILGGGDWINRGATYIESSALAAGRLSAPLGTLTVRGDHDHFAYRDRERSVNEITAALRKHGISMLHNEVKFVTVQDKKIALIFLSNNYLHRTPPDEITTLVESARGADFKLLITHQFSEKIARIVKNQVDLVLAAHTHGGQANPFVLIKHVLLSKIETPFVTGRYQIGKTVVIVTSGIGFSMAPFRYASPATVEIIDLFL